MLSAVIGVFLLGTATMLLGTVCCCVVDGDRVGVDLVAATGWRWCRWCCVDLLWLWLWTDLLWAWLMGFKGEPNISYIYSRYYKVPELIFGATEYTTAIDIWSIGCVLAELILGQPLFPGESGVDQLVEIIKVLGTPTREEIKCMNPNYTEFKFPQIKAHPWHKIFHKCMPPEAIDLVSRLLQYSPNLRCTAVFFFFLSQNSVYALYFSKFFVVLLHH
ncbi:unnamed protein product [Fraxinus pennsylvanica]|uniref:Protein kinase domain-containing protein n=1 Tax=Fraxinus pennsylvanica TaxID=56036 RepID=A0AAD2EBD0_9LAMI|nr:unnamed protein product [Fraxinus pennsylvanica]